MASKAGLSNLRGPALVTAITSVCASGFLLFGYDQGVMSGVVVSEYWLDAMGHPSSLMTGTITALYDVGAVLGAVLAAFSAEPLGRKRTLLLGSAVLAVGTIIMGSSYERIQFMVARVVTGVGIGFITSVTPVYQSEISSAAQRGWQVCAQLTTMLFGLLLAYIVNYGFYFTHDSIQWRFPLLFQLVFAVYILIAAPWLPDSPRWLLSHDKTTERGLLVLAKLRNNSIDDDSVRAEADDILEAIALENREQGSWMDLLRDGGLKTNKRFMLALGIQFMQQLSGINIVTYYAPTLFQNSLGMSGRMSLLMGLLLQVWYFVASFVTWFTIDRVGRRKLFISMALGMCAVLVAEAVCVAIGSRGAGIGAVFFVFAFEACFTWGWMATVWVYPAEILPLKVRAKGAALAAAADFLGNFLVVEVTPVGLENLGFGFYFIWAALNLMNAIVVWLFYPETANLPLESIDSLFTNVDYEDRKSDRPFYRKLQWSVVNRANLRVKIAKSGQTTGDNSDSQSEKAIDKGKDIGEHVERI